MKKSFVKLLSVLLSAFLVFTTAFSFPARAIISNADSSTTVVDKAKTIEKAREVYNNYKSSLKPSNGKAYELDDNVVLGENSSTSGKEDPEKIVRIIVELEEASIKDMAGSQTLSKAAANITLKNRVLNSQMSYKTQIQKINKAVQFRRNYSLLFNGFSLEGKLKDVENIKNIPGVKHVTIAKEFYPDMNYAKEITNVTDVWNNSEYGYKGEGMVVAIIDSGIDASHKDMRLTDESSAKIKDIKDSSNGMFSIKVPYGYNFADDNDNVVDLNPITGMHGMHVAGIVAANCENQEEIDSNLGIKGVAPEAQLLAMKVFSNNPNFGSAFSDDIIAAIEDSVAHGADVINMSLGSTAAFQDPMDAELIAVREANESGTVVVVSAGNSQYSTAPYKFFDVVDTGLVGAPGLAHESLQVASLENTNVVGPALRYESGQQSGLMYYTLSEVNPVGVLNSSNGYEIVNCGLGLPTDFQGKDLTGKIALMKRGTSSFIEKKLNAQAAGAVGAIVYNNTVGYINMATDPSVVIPGIFIGKTDGEMLLSLIAQGVTIKFNGEITSAINALSGNMSDFSSWGPTPNLDFKPQITTPGGNIWSTVNDDKYENMSGTSMAAPHMSGISALIVQHINRKFPNFTGENKAELAKTLAINTARPALDPRTNNAMYFSPRRQGAGVADAEAAVKNLVTVTDENNEAVVALKQIDNNVKTFKLKLTNYGNEDITYNAVDLSGVMTEQRAVIINTMSYDINVSGALVSFDKNTVTVPAGGAANVTVNITLPSTTPDNIFIEGFVSFAPQTPGVPAIGIPYMGFYGDWDEPAIYDAPVWDSANTWFGETTLLTEKEDGYYYLGFEDSKINPDHIAISPAEGANNSTVPFVMFFRNAKEAFVEILDENQRFIRTVAVITDIRKGIVSAEQMSNLMTDALWDGTIYDTKTGKYESVEDGQYYVQLRSRIDYPNARYQKLIMPVKFDSIEPIISQIQYDPSATNNLSFKTIDENSGIDGYMVYVNGSYYSQAWGDPDENGIYSLNINISNGTNNVEILTFDYAGNIGYALKEINNSRITITNPEMNEEVTTKDITLEYTVPQELLNSIDHFEISIDDLEKVNNEKNLSYNITNLANGLHSIKIDAVDSSSNIVDTNFTQFTVNAEGVAFAVKFDNFDTGNVYNSNNVVITGSVTTKPSIFKIAGQNVNIANDLTFEANIILTEGKVNKVSIYAEDNGKVLMDYSYNVYCDMTAPTINLTWPASTQDTTYIYVSEDTDTYKVEGQVSDNMFGYKLFINGNQIEDVELDIPDEAATLRNFSTIVELTGETNIIEVRATDCYTENETIKKIIVTKDNEKALRIKITRPVIKDGSIVIEGKSVTISGVVENAKKDVTLYVNGQKSVLRNNASNCRFTKTVVFDNFGQNVINIVAMDSFGGQANLTINVLTGENGRPSINLIYPKTSSVTTENAEYNVIFNVVDETTESLVVTARVGSDNIDIVKNEDGTYKANVKIQQGGRRSSNVTITAEDRWGNTTSKMLTIKYAKDSKAPEILVVEPTNMRVNTDTVDIKIKAIDYEQSDITSVTVYDMRGTTVIATTIFNQDSGCYEAVLPLPNVNNVFKIVAVDDKGNTSSKIITIIKR